MAKSGDKSATRGLEVRGQVDVEKYKAARALGGDQVTFELRAVKPNRSVAGLQVNCLVCLICVICVVCAAATAEDFGIKDLSRLTD